MPRPLSVFLGALIGILALEAALRMTIYEHEADRSYWGRGAFVADDTCVYRQAPSTIAVTGRRGVFGPVSIETNAEGYRDPRLPEDSPETARLMVVGASTMFGLGISDDEAVFSRRLEAALRSRPDMPDDLQVYNVSQTGYLSLELRELVQREVDRVKPVMVLLVLTPNTHTTHFDDRQIDIVNGYRLPRERPYPDPWIDFLRTRSYAFMQVASSPLAESGAYYQHQLLWKLMGARAGRPARSEQASGTRGDRADVVAHVREIRELLGGAGIELACAVSYSPHQRRRWLSRMLGEVDFEVHAIEAAPDWLISGDGHWTEHGHFMAASFIAPLIPAGPFQ